MSEEEFLELCLRKVPEGTKVVKVEKDGCTYFRIGEINLDKAAQAFKDLVK